MQVMQSNEFEKTEILVGQASPTQNFGVSDDPMLMSMLSTGFYGNPLRTMIQEIMFNAWDAHRMGECLDKPIDVYINEGTGLIIRDYGPGIPDDEIHPTYCMYGGSTKRKDKRQTGGFGLGSKSPFAYTESFTVTSMNQHVKCMYLISRVSEDGGKPGLTRLVKIDTTETGLMVTVPLVPGDRKTAYRYITDVLFLSGIKANVHYMDEEPQFIDSTILKPGEYHVDSSGEYRGVHAVYGGVRYEIPYHEDFKDELDFLKAFTTNRNALFIGFAPDTLTPVPNRESLNMSLKTREAIKTGIEVCIERFKEILTPLVHAFWRKNFETMKSNGIQAQFAMYRAQTMSTTSCEFVVSEFVKEMLPLVPLNVDPSMWKVGLHLLNNSRSNLISAFGFTNWNTILICQFCNAYPDSKQIGFACKNISPHRSNYEINKQIYQTVMPDFARDLYDFELQMQTEFPDDQTLHPTLRYQTDTATFTRITRQKIRKNTNPTNDYKIEVAKDSYMDPNVMYDSSNGVVITQLFVQKAILLGKTARSLSEAYVQPSQYFSNKFVNEGQYFNGVDTSSPLMGCVVYPKKGAYEKAKQILLAKGFKVIEAPEPERAKRIPGVTVKTVTTYPKLKVISSREWADYDNSIEAPTHFLYMLQSTINDDAYYNRYSRPTNCLIQLVTDKYPETVLIQNIKQADVLKEKGVITFEQAIAQIFEEIQTKKYRFRNIVRAIKIENDSNIPSAMLRDPIIQKAMGMVPIEDDDLTFWSEVSVYNTICNSEYNPTKDVSTKASKRIVETFLQDPLFQKIKANIASTSLFGETALSIKWSGMDPKDKPDFAKRISKFIQGN